MSQAFGHDEKLEAVQKLTEALESLDSFDREPAMSKVRDWPDQEFQKAAERILLVADEVLLIREYDTELRERLPAVLINKMGELARATKSNIELLAATNFIPGTSHTDQVRTNIIASAGHLNVEVPALGSFLALLGVAELRRRNEKLAAAETAAEESKKLFEAARVNFEQLSKRADSAITAANQAAEEQWIVGRLKHFNGARVQYKREAKWWGIAATSLAASVLVLASVFIAFGAGPPLPSESWAAAGNISHFAPRLLVATLVSFLMVTCVKNFRAARHNELLSTHRTLALSTFARFRDGEGKVSDLVLLQAAQAVFSIQPTAFGEHEPMSLHHGMELLAQAREASKP